MIRRTGRVFFRGRSKARAVGGRARHSKGSVPPVAHVLLVPVRHALVRAVVARVAVPRDRGLWGWGQIPPVVPLEVAAEGLGHGVGVVHDDAPGAGLLDARDGAARVDLPRGHGLVPPPDGAEDVELVGRVALVL